MAPCPCADPAPLPDLKPACTNPCLSLCFAFQFQLALVFFQKGTGSIGSVEQAHPLLVVKCHGKAAQSVDAHASLLAYLEFQAALLL